jgi:hypothetical protein
MARTFRVREIPKQPSSQLRPLRTLLRKPFITNIYNP